MVKSGLKKSIDTHDSDLAATEKNCLYDSEDYASAYLQVLNLNDIIPDPSRDLHSVICRKGDIHKLFKITGITKSIKLWSFPYQKIPVTFQILLIPNPPHSKITSFQIVVIPNSPHF